jgi:type VI secretion system protein ImpI
LATGLKLKITNSANNTTVERSFAKFPVRIGRNTLNDLNIIDRFVSQFHAVVEVHDRTLKLRDLGSSNGTKIGEGRAPAHQPVDLAPHNGTFGIGPLVLEAKLIEVDEVAEKPPQSLGEAGIPYDDNAVLEDSFVTNINEMVAFDNPALAAARAAFEAGGVEKPSGPPPDKKAFTGTLLLDENEVQKQKADAMRRIEAFKAAGAVGPGGTVSLTPSAPPDPMLKERRLETLALQGVREIAKALLPSAPPIEEPEDLVRFLSKVRDTIEVFLRCFIPLRDGYRQFASQLHIQRSNDSVEAAKDERELAASLLDWRKGAHGGDAYKSVEGTFADLMIHQLALLHAIMQGVKSLLDELSPKTIDAALEELAKQGKTNFSWGPWRFKELWRVFATKHSDIDDGDKRMFSALFGPDFAESYKQYRGTVDS